jgi:valyl-tRNA synthetase
MPFITEEIYTSLPGSGETIMLSDWPKPEYEGYEKESGMMQDVMDMIRAVRNIRSEMDVPPKVKVKMTVLTENDEAIAACAEYIKKLAYASEVEIIHNQGQAPENCVSVVSAIGESFLPLSDMIDIEAEAARLKKELKANESEISRSEGKLNNKGFVDKAPEAVVNEERAKLEKYRDIHKKLNERLAFLENISK